MLHHTNFIDIKKLSEFLGTNEDLSNILGELAAAIWDNNKTDDLYNTYKSKIDNLWNLGYIKHNDEGSLEFKDILHFEFFYSLNFLGNDALLSGKPLVEIAAKLWEKTHRQKSKNNSIKLTYDFPAICLIHLHNSLDIDLLSRTKMEFDTCFEKLNWDFDKALPYFNTSAEKVFDFIKLLFEQKSEKHIPHFANAISELCSVQPSIGIKILDYINVHVNEKIKDITPGILHGLTKSKGSSFTLPLVIEKLQSAHEYDIRNALFFLSRFSFSGEDWKNFGHAITIRLDILEKDTTESYKLMLPAIYTQIISFHPLAKGLLIEYSYSDNLKYQKAMSDVVWYRVSDFNSEDWFETVMIAAAAWDYSQAGIARNMQFTLNNLVETNPPLSLKYWNGWIENNNNSIAQLEIFRHEIATLFMKNRELVQEWITTSFLSPNDRFHLAMRIVISNLWINDYRNLSLDRKLLNTCSFWQIKYILFKILGYVDSKESLESLTYSILEKHPFDYDVAQLVANAFINHICYNYGGTYDFLKKKEETATADQKTVIAAITEGLDKYFEHVKEIRHIKELKWQQKGNKSFTQMRMEKISEEIKEGMKKGEESSIRSLFTNINLKGGKKFFSKYEGNYTQSTPLQNMGSSFELPFGEQIDPVKEAMNRVQWRKYQLQS